MCDTPIRNDDGKHHSLEDCRDSTNCHCRGNLENQFTHKHHKKTVVQVKYTKTTHRLYMGVL